MLRIKEILEEKNLAGKELAEMTDLSRVYISDVINNKKFPRKDTLLKIAKALDVDIRDLFVSTKVRTAEDIVKEINRLSEEALKKMK